MNTSRTRANGNRGTWRWLRRAHRWVGVSLLLFVLLFSVTGIALNHAGDLELDRRYVGWSWLLDVYGVQVPEPGASFTDRNHRATLLGNRLFLDGRDTGLRDPALSGMAVTGSIIVVGGAHTAYVLTPDGEIIEAMDLGTRLQGPIDKVGRTGDRVVLRSAGRLYASDPDVTQFEPASDGTGIAWPAATPPDDAEMAVLAEAWRGQGVTVERLLLDLHSGRIFSRVGPWLLDIAALFLIVLSVSGFLLSNARNRRNP